MKKLLVLLLVLAGAFFAVKKWSPATLEKLASMLPKRSKEAANADPRQWLPAPEPAPTANPPAPAPAPTPEPPAATAVDKTAQVIVLCYHRVEGAAGGALSITPELFEQHMQRIRDSGASVVSMQDFLAWRRNEKTIPKKSYVITVDDGYLSTFEAARPILQKFGYPWTCFIYTKFIGSGGKSLTWEQLATLRDEGVEIGCHTASHINLREARGRSPEAYEAWLRSEIIASKELIERKLAVKCAAFAYPEGRYGPKVLDLVKEAGYEAAFTVYGQRVTHGAPGDRIGRFAWYGRRPQDMEMALKFEGPLSSSEAEPPMAAELSAAMMVTQPMNGEVIAEPEPVLKANLSTLGKFDANSLAMRLSGAGPIPFKYDRENRIIEARPPHPLKPGEYTVVVTAMAGGKRVDTQWAFRYDPSGGLNSPLDQLSASPPAR
jgi:peptidoglycan/xylan/chitin deacetylase (PgdA/CDA1 family)